MRVILNLAVVVAAVEQVGQAVWASQDEVSSQVDLDLQIYPSAAGRWPVIVRSPFAGILVANDGERHMAAWR